MGEKNKREKKIEVSITEETLASLKNLETNLQESEQKMESTIDTFKSDTTQSIKTLKEKFEETKKKSKL